MGYLSQKKTIVLHSLVSDWHLEVELEEGEFDHLIQLANECVEDTVDGRRVDLGEVGRRERALRPPIAFIHHALTG